MKVKMEALVRAYMENLMEKYQMILISISDEEVLLKTGNYTLDIFYDRDGVNIIYFDRRSIKGYNIFLFLAKFRRDLLVFLDKNSHMQNFSDTAESELKSLAQHLHSAGGDILAGSKEWIDLYPWPPVSPRQQVVKFL